VVGNLGGELHRLSVTDQVGLVALALQGALFAAGKGRAVGIVDLLIAATAIVHHAVIVHYDADFELLAGVEARLKQRWIVPPGSVD